MSNLTNNTAELQNLLEKARGLPEAFSGSWNDLKDKPDAFPPSAHNQAASTITAGTFAGQVVAKAGSQAAGTSLLRNTKLVASETTPTNEGEIFWIYG